MGLLLLRIIGLLLSKEPITQDAFYSPNNIANFNIFCGEKIGALS